MLLLLVLLLLLLLLRLLVVPLDQQGHGPVGLLLELVVPLLLLLELQHQFPDSNNSSSCYRISLPALRYHV